MGAGATIVLARDGRVIFAVSILTRPWGRVQHWDTVAEAFNTTLVSILTRPWGRVQRLLARRTAIEAHVSILTRPWGRVQRFATQVLAAGSHPSE